MLAAWPQLSQPLCMRAVVPRAYYHEPNLQLPVGFLFEGHGQSHLNAVTKALLSFLPVHEQAEHKLLKAVLRNRCVPAAGKGAGYCWDFPPSAAEAVLDEEKQLSLKP